MKMLNNCKITLITQYKKYSKRNLNAAVVLSLLVFKKTLKINNTSNFMQYKDH